MSTSSPPSFIKIHQAVLEKKSKMWKVYDRLTDDRRTDDGWCAMTIAHSSLRLRWANKKQVLNVLNRFWFGLICQRCPPWHLIGWDWTSLQPLNWFWWNLAESKYKMYSSSSTRFVFSDQSIKNGGCPGLWYIFGFFSASAQQRLTPPVRKKVLNIL